MRRNYSRKCVSCGSSNTKKDWKRRGRQSYRCKQCWHVWIQPRRSNTKLDPWELYKWYAIHKQTYKELADRYWTTKKMIQELLDSYNPELPVQEPKQIVLLIDTTYFGSLGVMAFKDAWSKKMLTYQIVASEKKEFYSQWVKQLQEDWREILAIVCDGRRWLLWGFGEIPTQMCHFHQCQIMRRYITKNPKLQANKELKEIVYWLPRTDKACFESELQRRYEKHKEFLNEQREDRLWKKRYVHTRTRSAYFSLKRNMKYLFVYHEYLKQFDIPNTTNAIEAEFSHIKYKVNLHRWLRMDRKLKLIDYIIKSRY